MTTFLSYLKWAHQQCYRVCGSAVGSWICHLSRNRHLKTPPLTQMFKTHMRISVGKNNHFPLVWVLWALTLQSLRFGSTRHGKSSQQQHRGKRRSAEVRCSTRLVHLSRAFSSPVRDLTSFLLEVIWSASKLDRWCDWGSTGASISVCCCSSLWKRKNSTINGPAKSQQTRKTTTNNIKVNPPQQYNRLVHSKQIWKLRQKLLYQ